MLLATLLDRISGAKVRGDTQHPIGGVAYDSRRVRPGDLFVAIRGHKADGELFIRDAVQRGASAVASESGTGESSRVPTIRVPDARRFLAEAARAYYGDPDRKLRLVAVTGTNGKTTTAHLVESILRRAGYRTCLSGTLGTLVGERRSPGARTTPESADLYRFLHEAVLGECTHGALEVSSHALALKRVYGMKFTTAVFTNLTRDHLDFHGDMESYFAAKRLLFTADGGNDVEAAVLNADDPYARRLAPGLRCRLLWFGFEGSADVRPLEVHSGIDGSALRLATPAGEIGLRTRLPGRPNVCNVLAATAAALTLGIPTGIVAGGIEAVEGVPGRMERIGGGLPFSVVVDYAHTPDALEHLLETVGELPHRRIITVFGCGGDRDRTKRPLMGSIAARLSDRVIATSDNPRSEDPGIILDEIRAGLGSGPAPYRIVADRREAIGLALAEAAPNDIVVIAGKGHEDYQVIGDRSLPFDDREVARECLRAMRAAEPLPGEAAVAASDPSKDPDHGGVRGSA